MGSGHFLTAAVDRVEARFAAFLAERPIPGVTQELDQLRAHANEAMGDLAVDIESSALLRRMIARRCIYGVDRNRLAVELARVALWIHTFIPGLPLSFLNHNLVVGDSLTGVATLDEVREALTETGPQRSHFDAPIEEALHRSEEPLRRLANIADATPKQIQEARKAAADAEQAVEPLRALLDLVVAYRTGDKADPPTLDSAEGLDELVDHPDRQSARVMEALHFPVAFPEVFLRDRPGFDALIGNPPWEEVKVERLGFWLLRFPGLKSLKQKDQRPRLDELEAAYPAMRQEFEREFARAERLRMILTNGPFPGIGTGDADLYKAFCWRFWHLVREDGGIGVVLPRSALSANGSTAWRNAVLEGGTFHEVTMILNNRNWFFADVHPQYTVGLVAIQKGQQHTGTLYMRGPYASHAAYANGIEKQATPLQRVSFLGWTDTASFPLIPSPEAFDVFVRLRAHPRLDTNTGDWRALPVRELDATNDRKHMTLSADHTKGLWPVYKGASFDLWNPNTGEYYARADPEYITGILQDKRLRQQRHARSAFSAYSTRWANDPATLPCRHPRIAFRGISNRTNTRTVVAALVPGQVVLTNAAPYLLWPRGSEQDVAYLLGVLASMPLDWYARRFVETNLNLHILNAFPIPRPDHDHPLRQVVVDTAGRLAAVDERYSDWAGRVGVPVGSVRPDEKDTYLARLDAAVALLYGLTRDELHTLYMTFHEGWDSTAWEQAVLREYETLEPYTEAVEAE
ncbi:MAG: hypothetical protein U5K73_08375 [Halofilum sp. (in: g-proteobacteria)]|nr:hypothetical protein [Halofilum sp. (in: g-proteobacteria)]